MNRDIWVTIGSLSLSVVSITAMITLAMEMRTTMQGVVGYLSIAVLTGIGLIVLIKADTD